MKIFGKSLSEYLRFEKGFLILVLVVGLARLGLSLAGVPNATVKFVSLTVLLLLGLIYYSVRVHTSGFGSYKQLLPVLALPVILANLIIISGIMLAMGTGKDNIFSAPEYSGGGNGKTWGHVAGHFIVMVVGPIILWGIGSLIMLLTRKLTGGRQPGEGAARA
ncbi:MAG TPA: hypothetical protein VG204_09250 [Terriglobia bacterium]|nr:hypothetical protein [Terriglobia bacterium]